jgi:hypothetical protein
MLEEMARDRSHWDAAKRAFAQDAHARDLDAARLTPEERARLGLQMGAASLGSPATDLELEQRGLAKAQLHVRWRKLQARRGCKS